MTCFDHVKNVLNRTSSRKGGCAAEWLAWLLPSCSSRRVSRRPPAGPEATFFVAVDGNDSWSGTLSGPNAEGTDGPFATLAGARDAVRRMKAANPLSQPVTVMVRGGAYYLDETLVFGPQDSGAKECPVSYTAYPGETPVAERRQGHRRFVEKAQGRDRGLLDRGRQAGEMVLSATGRERKATEAIAIAQRGRVSERRCGERDVVQVQRGAHAEVG